MASPTAPVAFADSEPVTLSVPVIGVDSDSTSCAPVAVMAPREAVQPMSAFCRICDTGFSALPVNVRCAAWSAASRIADSAIATGAITTEERGAGGSGGNSTSTGGATLPRGASQSIALRLIDERHRDDRDRGQNHFQMLRQTRRPPGPIEPVGILQGRGGQRQSRAALRHHSFRRRSLTPRRRLGGVGD